MKLNVVIYIVRTLLIRAVRMKKYSLLVRTKIAKCNFQVSKKMKGKTLFVYNQSKPGMIYYKIVPGFSFIVKPYILLLFLTALSCKNNDVEDGLDDNMVTYAEFKNNRKINHTAHE